MYVENIGMVYLVGAGPGDPDLLTVRAYRLIQEADIILHDRLCGTAFREIVPSGTQCIDVGKCGHESTNKDARQQDIYDLMRLHARLGKIVVRLKGGDPFIFGRGGEEIHALHHAGIPYEVVPGISAAQAAASRFEIPLTHRGVSSHITYVTGHQMDSDASTRVDWQLIAQQLQRGGTVAMYMGSAFLNKHLATLQSCGVSDQMPLAIASRVALPGETLYMSTLGCILHREEPLMCPLPAMIIIGDSVCLSGFQRKKQDMEYRVGDVRK